MAFLSLVCSIPVQYQRDGQRQACLFFARFYADEAAVISLIADNPSPWIDAFRPELRQRAAWAMEDGQRFARRWTYDALEHERVSAANRLARRDKLFWARFNSAAALHGYKRPRVNRGITVVWGLDGFLIRTSPTFVLATLLTVAFVKVRRSRRRQAARRTVVLQEC